MRARSFFFFKDSIRLNESPSEKEGKSTIAPTSNCQNLCLNESPSEKEGKLSSLTSSSVFWNRASMKVPPKRKGNTPA